MMMRNTKRSVALKSDNQSDKKTLAQNALSSDALNTLTSIAFSKRIFGDIDIEEAMVVMLSKIKKVKAGSLDCLEETLFAQSVTLDAIFNLLAQQAINSQYLDKLDIYLKLALRAQSQSAKTIETLAGIKTPSIVYARQANISQGPQQINNSQVNFSAKPHVGKVESLHNELLKDALDENMDHRGTASSEFIDREMEAVG